MLDAYQPKLPRNHSHARGDGSSRSVEYQVSGFLPTERRFGVGGLDDLVCAGSLKPSMVVLAAIPISILLPLVGWI